jgi:hypothetical protein
MADLQKRLDVVNVEILAVLVVAVLAVVTVLVEFETDALVALVTVRVGLVDLCVLGQFAVCLERARLVGGVLEAAQQSATHAQRKAAEETLT